MYKYMYIYRSCGKLARRSAVATAPPLELPAAPPQQRGGCSMAEA